MTKGTLQAVGLASHQPEVSVFGKPKVLHILSKLWKKNCHLLLWTVGNIMIDRWSLLI